MGGPSSSAARACARVRSRSGPTYDACAFAFACCHPGRACARSYYAHAHFMLSGFYLHVVLLFAVGDTACAGTLWPGTDFMSIAGRVSGQSFCLSAAQWHSVGFGNERTEVSITA